MDGQRNEVSKLRNVARAHACLILPGPSFDDPY